MTMKKYKLVSKKGEGTFSEVVKAENIENGKFYAIKCMKNSFKSLQQVNNLREIQALRKLSPHPNIIHLEEVLFDEPTGRLAMVFELMEANLYDLISGRRDHLDPELVRSIGYQMFIALKYMHDRSIFHRDIKPENILIDKGGKILKLADFGSCRSTHSKPPFTEYIATRWYRSPECLLTEGHYGAPMDIWGAGCVLFEITALFPLFPGADEVDQINRIHKVVGTPSKDVLLKLKRNKSSKMDFKFREQSGVGIRHFIPHASIECINLLNRTLEYDFNHRIASRAACDHEYFDSLRVGQKTARKGSSNSSPTSVRNPHGKDARDEKPISYRQRGVEKNPPQRVIKAKKTESRTAVHKSQPKPKAKPKPKPKPGHPASKPTKQKDKSPGRFRPRFGLSLSKSKSDDSSKRNNRPFHTRLPKLDKGKNTTKTDSKLGTKSNSDSSRSSNTTRRKNKYANVASSGYGKLNYKPKPTKLKSVNPSATSTLTDPTAKTSGGTSGYISSKSFEDESKPKTTKHLNSTAKKKQLASTRKEKTLSKLPTIR